MTIPETKQPGRKSETIHAIVRGQGFLPWQSRESGSDQERDFRRRMESRKDALLDNRQTVNAPVFPSGRQRKKALENIRTTWWGKAWFNRLLRQCDPLLSLSAESLERMIPTLTPTSPYGFTCPNCVGSLSQEGMGISMYKWDPQDPDVIVCKVCGQRLPDERYPETGRLVCPRLAQHFSFYCNEQESAHPEDFSGLYAWKWVGKPIHLSFSGIVRYEKIRYMIGCSRQLGLAYCLTEEHRYAILAQRILLCLADRISRYLYHDYFDTIADCDPLYAAWHERQLPLEWKRHPVESAYADDTLEQAAMLQSYWGAGRIGLADSTLLNTFCQTYDLIRHATDESGSPLWTDAQRRHVERDLLLEYAFGAEPFLGGAGKADNLSNKSPYVYVPFAYMGRLLGLPDYVHVALSGYEALRDHSFLFDGFSRESPAYTALYLTWLAWLPEWIDGYDWPDDFIARKGRIQLYAEDARLRRIYRTQADSLRANGKYFPLSDTLITGAPQPHIFEIGLKRFPEYFAGRLPALYRGQAGYGNGGWEDEETPAPEAEPTHGLRPGEYALFNLPADELAADNASLPEMLFPAWRTALLRHGKGPETSEAALPFNLCGVHRHADNLSLFYANRGRIILGEQGYVGDSAMLAWGGSTQSHNLVVVDDEDQLNEWSREDKETDLRTPAFRMMLTSPWISAVEAQSGAYPRCSVYRRLVVMLKGPEQQSLLVDIFRACGGSRHAYRIFSELAASDTADGSLSFEGLTLPPLAPVPDFGGSTLREHVYGLKDAVGTDTVPPSWNACWREPGAAYRLHLLSAADRVEASHGPGQQTLDQTGRRVRYLDVIRKGDAPLSSTFVALHEPSGPDGALPVKRTERLPLPPEAGPQAVALKIETAWGDVLLFSEIQSAVAIEGQACRGLLGVFFRTPDGDMQRLVCGEQTWRGEITGSKDQTLQTSGSRPSGFPEIPPEVNLWVGVGEESHATGYPVKNISDDSLTIDQFPVQPASRFFLHSVRTKNGAQ